MSNVVTIQKIHSMPGHWYIWGNDTPGTEYIMAKGLNSWSLHEMDKHGNKSALLQRCNTRREIFEYVDSLSDPFADMSI